MATFEDSAAGWRIYRDSQGTLDLNEINELLAERGYNRVARRSLSHYQKLARLGYDNYLSMNRLDLRHASDSIADLLDEARYEERPTETPAFLALATPTGMVRLEGIVTRIADAYVAIETDDVAEAWKAAKSPKYNRGVLVFTRTGSERAVKVHSARDTDGRVELLLTLRSLLTADELFPDPAGPTSAATLTIVLPDEPPLAQVSVAIYRSFDLLEATRAIVETLLSVADDDRRRAPATKVQSVRAGSDLVLALIGSEWMWPILVALLPRVVASVRGVIGTVGDYEQIQAGRHEERRAEERHNLQIASLQLDNLKKAVDLREILESDDGSLLDDLGINLDALLPQVVQRLEALKGQAIEAAADVSVEGDVTLDLGDDIEDRDA